MIMNNIIKYGFIAGVAIGALAAVILLTRGCSKEISMDPEDVVEAFTKAVAAGRFEEADGLCDRNSMSGYIDTYRTAMEKRSGSDSAAVAIAAGILSDISVEVTDVVKAKGSRTVFYTIRDIYGHSKEKVATLKDEEGEWKVTEIRDRN